VQCIAELKCKAKFFEQAGLIYTLNAKENNIIKSDTIVTPDVHADLRAGFDKLRAAQAAAPDWHPGSNDMVQDLVHPSLYPLVYGMFIRKQSVPLSIITHNFYWVRQAKPSSYTTKSSACPTP
jgi:hypothetical protein